jgi:hypothetical protein
MVRAVHKSGVVNEDVDFFEIGWELVKDAWRREGRRVSLRSVRCEKVDDAKPVNCPLQFTDW